MFSDCSSVITGAGVPTGLADGLIRLPNPGLRSLCRSTLTASGSAAGASVASSAGASVAASAPVPSSSG